MIGIRLSLLGSTGLIGTQALEVVDELGGIEVDAISGNKNINLLEFQIRRYKPRLCAVADYDLAKELKIKVADTNTKVVGGESGLVEAAACGDIVLCAIVGFAALVPLLVAIRAKKTVALASKEALVVAGHIVMDEVKRNDVKLIPIDSEHCAIKQCLTDKETVSKIILTASGGPFYGMTREQLKGVTPQQALAHPTWKMGKKISIDSATLMNKGFEIIECKWLFGIENIEVVIQKESIIHSMVEYNDRSVIAQMAVPSMKLPIQYAFTCPERRFSSLQSLNFAALGHLSFDSPSDVFRCLSLARLAMEYGGSMPTVLNSANEIAVSKFLSGQISFLDIPDFIEKCMLEHTNILNPSINDIININNEIKGVRA